MFLLNKLGWVLETCTDNFPCHQTMSVSNQYSKTSGREWRIGWSKIWMRKGRDSILCRVYWTPSQKWSRFVTTSVVPHPEKTIPSVLVFIQWKWESLVHLTGSEHMIREFNQSRGKLCIRRDSSVVWQLYRLTCEDPFGHHHDLSDVG
jgi:hypothetical protein